MKTIMVRQWGEIAADVDNDVYEVVDRSFVMGVPQPAIIRGIENPSEGYFVITYYNGHRASANGDDKLDVRLKR